MFPFILMMIISNFQDLRSRAVFLSSVFFVRSYADQRPHRAERGELRTPEVQNERDLEGHDPNNNYHEYSEF